MHTAQSDLVLDTAPARRTSWRHRGAGALGVIVLALPFGLAIPAPVTASATQPSAPQPVAVHATAVRSVLTGAEGFDRPSSAGYDAAQIQALAARTVVRASRDNARVAPTATAATAAAAPKTLTRAVPKAKPAAKAGWKKPRWVRPSRGVFTSGYKYRWGRMHKGIDLAGPTGTPIVAASDGVVTFAGAAGGYGRLVLIRHAGGIVTAYGHMSKIKTYVGERVKAGEVIALVGSAGRSTGPHLHFEVRTGGGTINPKTFLAKHKVYV